MKKREVGNLFLHLGVGAALAALVVWNHWFVVLATFVYAFLREQAQHRWVIDLASPGVPDQGDPRTYYVEKRTFFDFSWLGWRQAFEIGQWVLGAVLGCLTWEVRGLIVSMAVQWAG
jgi:hypothetical protein